MTAYYNEIDPKAAEWLRELIKAGAIAPGVVDTRSIEDILPNDLRDFTQCHFFAGIGGWSYALRLAGVPDSFRVWTGSCPCQPFSAAGQRAGTSDERHLWPALLHLVQQCRPAILFGEQVASKDGLAWLDIVSTDLEVSGYAVGAADLCAAGVGAPHIRQRLYFVGHSNDRGSGRNAGTILSPQASIGRQMRGEPYGTQPASPANHVAYAYGAGEHSLLRPEQGNTSKALRRESTSGLGGQLAARDQSEPSQLAYADGGHASTQREQRGGEHGQQPQDGSASSLVNSEGQQMGLSGRPRIARGAGYWTGCEWIPCRDGKARPVEPGTFPLANGLSNRVGLLRGYGNAIVPQVAQAFIEAAWGI